jgi:hypothetical protein
MSHEEIVRKFLETKSVDFNALGKFVAEFGPQIAASSSGDYGVRFGHYNITACFLRVPGTQWPEWPVTPTSATEIASEVAGGSKAVR